MKVIKFYADWCGPCQTFAPIFEEFKEKHPEIDIESINVDNDQQLASKYGVKNIPAVVFIKDDGDSIKKVGLLTMGQLEREV